MIDGLEEDPQVELHCAVPAALPGLLRERQVDAALVPVIDLARAGEEWERVSDACIASDGRTLTVRVFSKVPPERIEVLHVDADSHTSVALARLVWANVYRRPLRIEPMPEADRLRDCESVLLIGDKVVTTPMPWFDHHVDLGDAWKKWTHLPFVFAVWAAPAEGDTRSEPGAQATGRYGTGGRTSPQQPARLRSGLCLPGRQATGGVRMDLDRLLRDARDRGVARAGQIAAEIGPQHGWPVSLAVEYLTRRLMYALTPEALAGMNRFIELLTRAGIVPETGGCIA
ncbi:MAG: hypothetical protein HY718_12555 [Planctomycetes bacterium]|nr:hypothetical protein [Planctomycetota bacterium]